MLIRILMKFGNKYGNPLNRTIIHKDYYISYTNLQQLNCRKLTQINQFHAKQKLSTCNMHTIQTNSLHALTYKEKTFWYIVYELPT
jgi:hypothetical protein